MATGSDLGDLLASAAGANVNRPALNAFVANSQATNGLRSQQTEVAMLNAQKAQEEAVARGQLEDAYVRAGVPQSSAHLMTVASIAAGGGAVNALDAYQASQRGVLGDVNQMRTAAQTAAQQAIEGKVALPYAVPNNYAVLPNAVQPNVQQTAQGAAQTAQSHAVTVQDLERAEAAHAAAKNNVQGGLTPDAVETAARVVMADPKKMSQYAGYGQSGQTIKTNINNKITNMLNAADMQPEDMIRQRAIAQASVGSTGAAAKQAEILDAYMPLIKGNSQRIMQLLDQIDAAGGPAGSNEPIVNGYARLLGRQLGSDDLAELHSVFGSFQPELARLLTAGPSMNGVVSDKSRGDVQSMAPETMSSSNARRVLNRIDVELNLRRQGVENALQSGAEAQLPVISAHPRGVTPVAPAAAPPPAAAPLGSQVPRPGAPPTLPGGLTLVN
jgi:hypothetical protein